MQICQICFEDAEDVHHIIPRRKDGLDVLENLKSVCQRCHGLIELRTIRIAKMRDIKMVRLDDDVHADLTEIGNKNESYSDVIRRLIRFYRAEGKAKR